MTDLYNIDHDEFALETSTDAYGQWAAGEDDFAVNNPLSYDEYMTANGYKHNPGSEEQYITALEKDARRRERLDLRGKGVGRENLAHADARAQHARNQQAANERRLLETIKMTRVAVPTPIIAEGDVEHYYQGHGFLLYYHGRQKRVVRHYQEGLKRLVFPAKPFKFPLPALRSLTITGMRTKGEGRFLHGYQHYSTGHEFTKVTISVDYTEAPQLAFGTYKQRYLNGTMTSSPVFDCLPLPDTVPGPKSNKRYFDIVFNPNEDTVTYTWTLSRAARNRLAHALYGNGPGPGQHDDKETRMACECNGDKRNVCKHHHHRISIAGEDPAKSPKGTGSGKPKSGGARRIAMREVARCTAPLGECTRPECHWHDERAGKHIGIIDDEAERIAGEADAAAELAQALWEDMQGGAAPRDWEEDDIIYDGLTGIFAEAELTPVEHVAIPVPPPAVAAAVAAPTMGHKASKVAAPAVPVVAAAAVPVPIPPAGGPTGVTAEAPLKPAGKGKMEKVPPTAAELEVMWDLFLADVTTHLYKSSLNITRYTTARSRINTWMVRAGLPLTHANVCSAAAIIDREVAACKATMGSDGAFALAYGQAKGTTELERDVEEGTAKNLFLLHPSRLWHTSCRTVRKAFEEMTTTSPGGPNVLAKPISYTSPFPYLKTTCCAPALEKWLDDRDKTMQDLLDDNLGDILPRGMRFSAARADLQCDPPQQIPVGFTTQDTGLWIPSTHCWHNEALAILARQQVGVNMESTPETRKAVYDLGVDIALALWPNLDYVAPAQGVMDAEYLEGKTRGQKLTFEKGRTAMTAGGSIKYECSSFVKAEISGEKDPLKQHPRNICGNHPDGTYISEVGPEYGHMQHAAVKELFRGPNNLPKRFFVYTSGLSGEEVGELVSHMEHLNFWPIEVDLTRCDGHTSEEAREAELKWYRENGMSAELLERLRRDQRISGRSKLGFEFSAGPSEPSGRPDTSWGTSLRLIFIDLVFGAWTNWREEQGNVDVETGALRRDLMRFIEHSRAPGMFAAMVAAFKISPTYGVRLGDDNVMGRLGEPQKEVVEMAYAMAGHVAVVKVFKPSEYNKVTFCSSLFWDIGNGRRVLDRFPFRTLSKTFMNSDPALRTQDMPGFVAGVARGFKHSYWVPLLGDVCKILADTTIASRVDKRAAATAKYKYCANTVENIDQDALEAHFLDFYGVEISTFAYLKDVPWHQTGVVFNLPGFREMLAIEGFTDGSLKGLEHPDLELVVNAAQGVDALNPQPSFADDIADAIGALLS